MRRTSSMITNSLTNPSSCNMLIPPITKSPRDGISHLPLGGIPLIDIPSPKTRDLKTTRSNILTLSNLNYRLLVRPNLVLLVKEIKNPFLKSSSEMLRKNLPLTVTIWRFLMNLPEIALKEKLLESDGNLIKEILLIIEKMSTQLFKINKIHQQSMRVNIDLISVR